MSRSLVLSVRVHDHRYHGVGEAVASPARLFQALVAAAGSSGPLRSSDVRALEWLEALPPPTIASPRTAAGQTSTVYVPNNDLDAKGGDARRIAAVRAAKAVRPALLHDPEPWLFVWSLPAATGEEELTDTVCSLADRLYQFGRGVDMAWAWGEVMDSAAVFEHLESYRGVVAQPTGVGGPDTLRCPTPGSLKSLMARHDAPRLVAAGRGAKVRQVFAQPPKAVFSHISYDSLPDGFVYELRDRTSQALQAWPLERIAMLVGMLRDGAASRLRGALPQHAHLVDRFLIGRKADGADDAPTDSRIRLVPLPSIGHTHADMQIRRVLVEVPRSCPLRADDVDWAFSSLELSDADTGELLDVELVSGDSAMVRHFRAPARTATEQPVIWRTVTPAALPDGARRRRIDPKHRVAEAKGGAERHMEQERAAGAVRTALRHAGIRARVTSIRVQKEPFTPHGRRVEEFAPPSRFPKERLWHVEVSMDTDATGPLAIGDGRFLGLGILAPVRTVRRGEDRDG